MNFEFATATRILFGRGRLSDLAPLASEFGRRALLVAAPHLERGGVLNRIEHDLADSGVAAQRLLVHGEPEVEVVDAAAELARASGAEVVIAIGGGSVIDAGKAAAALAVNGGSVREYLEGVGTGRTIDRRGLPFIAAPTTAGTGSEVTRNAVIASRAEGFKKSIRSVHLLPSVALVDPALTDGMPPAQTAASGLDALTQLIEPYVSARATPVTDALALEGVRLAGEALPRAFRDGTDRAARDTMSLASLYGGLCLANAGLGAVHGIAAALGARYDVPHGLACASVLVQATEAKVAALERRAPASETLARYARLGEVLTRKTWSDPQQARSALVEFLRDLVGSLGVPRLGSFGLSAEAIPALVPECRGSSMKANPILLEDEEIAAALAAAR